MYSFSTTGKIYTSFGSVLFAAGLLSVAGMLTFDLGWYSLPVWVGAWLPMIMFFGIGVGLPMTHRGLLDLSIARMAGMVDVIDDSVDTRQLEYGRRLYDQVLHASTQNPRVSDQWKLLVKKMEDNGGKYSVVIQLREPGVGVNTMMQFSVDTKNGVVTIQRGPYNEPAPYSLDDFEDAVEKACTLVRDFQ